MLDFFHHLSTVSLYLFRKWTIQRISPGGVDYDTQDFGYPGRTSPVLGFFPSLEEGTKFGEAARLPTGTRLDTVNPLQ